MPEFELYDIWETCAPYISYASKRKIPFCDTLVKNNLKEALMRELGKKYTVIIPAGADIDFYCEQDRRSGTSRCYWSFLFMATDEEGRDRRGSATAILWCTQVGRKEDEIECELESVEGEIE